MKSDERSLEITLRSKSGVTVIVKCDCMVNKVIWFGAFESQIEVLASKIASAARAITAEERALSINQIGDEDAVTLNVVIPSVAVKEAEMSATANVTALGLGESHPLTSLFNHLKGEAISPTHVAPPSYEELPQTPRTATRMLLNSFVSSPNLITAMEAQQAAGEETPVDEEVEGEEAVEFITEEEDVSEEDDQNQEEVTEEMMEEAHEENGGEEAGPESETTDIDGATPVETDSSEGTIARRAAFKAYRPASAKFGCHPEQIVCLADFGVAPELLTTAQKVAILESAAYQYRSNQLAMQARVSRRSFTAVSPMKNSSSSDGYTPTGLRLQDADSQETHIENDGGAVAKTGDTLKNKIHNWEAWSSKDKASPVPKR